MEILTRSSWTTNSASRRSPVSSTLTCLFFVYWTSLYLSAARYDYFYATGLNYRLCQDAALSAPALLMLRLDSDGWPPVVLLVLALFSSIDELLSSASSGPCDHCFIYFTLEVELAGSSLATARLLRTIRRGAKVHPGGLPDSPRRPHQFNFSQGIYPRRQTAICSREPPHLSQTLGSHLSSVQFTRPFPRISSPHHAHAHRSSLVQAPNSAPSRLF